MNHTSAFLFVLAVLLIINIPSARSNTTDHSGEANKMVTMHAYVTAYNTTEDQTDDSPCIAAGGEICGRTDVVACPRSIPLHRHVFIASKRYECMDRMAARYPDRFDVSCDKDKACPNKITGWYEVRVENE
jgi:hypothetical protein